MITEKDRTDILIWVRGWQDTLTAAGKTIEQANEWIWKHYNVLVRTAGH